MTKLLILVAAVVAIVWLLRRAFAGAAPERDAPKAGPAKEGDLVACAHCGVNLLLSEARSAGGRSYCSEEHGRLGPRGP
jgi:uncharacterized protein